MHLEREWPQVVCTYRLQQEKAKIQQKLGNHDMSTKAQLFK